MVPQPFNIQRRRLRPNGLANRHVAGKYYIYANVKRVLSRFAKVKETSLSKRDKKLWEISSNVTPKSDIFEYTQGIMDLGATICTTKDPNCLQCPLNEICASSYNVEAPKKISKVVGMAIYGLQHITIYDCADFY